MGKPRLQLSATKASEARRADRRYLVLLGLVILLAAVISWVTQDTLSGGPTAWPTARAAVTAVP